MDPFLQRCLDLARLPGAAVEPNPRVGAVVVYQGRIIGEGFHREYGGPHAEVNAVASVKDASLLPHSTLYVSLEPCNHHGKTPPCTGLILQHAIPRVVIGSLDPNPQMAGRSVAMLREKGVEVTVHSDPGPFQALNAHFWLNQREKRPFVTLKWAESKDGFIARFDKNGKAIRTAISSPGGSRFVHALRANHQAILVGHKTVLTDDPALDTRKWPGPNPVKIIFDPECVVPRSARVFSTGRVIVLNTKRADRQGHIHYLDISGQDLRLILERLYQEERIGSILVEGGNFTHQRFLERGLWDHCWRNIGEMALGAGVPAPELGAQDRSCLAETFADDRDIFEHYIR